jgi:hypothetical protein
VEPNSNELAPIRSAELKPTDESSAVLAVRATTARASLDKQAVRVLDDAEWTQMGQRLVEFAKIVSEWHRAKNNTLRLGNVDGICQLEP